MKKLDIVSYSKTQAIVMGLVGLLLGFIYSVGGFFIDLFVTLGWVVSSETPGLSYGTILAFGALVGMPIIGIVFGFISGLIGAALYNKIIKRKN